MFPLNLDTMIEALDALQRERGYVAATLLDRDDPTPEFEQRMQDRINRINRACTTLADQLIEAVEEMA